MIGVLGATGKIGREVVRALRERDADFVGIVRDPAAASAALGPGVPLRRGDMADPASLDAAFAGLDRLFLVCAIDRSLAALEGNAIAAARRAGLSRVVKSSAAGPMIEPQSPTPVGRQHATSEQALKDSGLGWTILRPNFLMQSSLSQKERIAGESRIELPISAQVPISMVHTGDIGDCAAVALTDDGEHAGRTYTLTGAPVTMADVAATFSAVLGRPIAIVEVPEAKARENMERNGLPDWLRSHFVGVAALLGGGKLAEPTDDVRRVTGHPPRDVAAYVAENRAAFGG